MKYTIMRQRILGGELKFEYCTASALIPYKGITYAAVPIYYRKSRADHYEIIESASGLKISETRLLREVRPWIKYNHPNVAQQLSNSRIQNAIRRNLSVCRGRLELSLNYVSLIEKMIDAQLISPETIMAEQETNNGN